MKVKGLDPQANLGTSKVRGHMGCVVTTLFFDVGAGFIRACF